MVFAGGPTTAAASFTIGDKAYVLKRGTGLGNFWEFDPTVGSMGKWEEIKGGTPGFLRQSLAVFTIGNVAYMGLGRSDSRGDILDEFWKFDPIETDKWTRLADFGGDPREHAVGFAIGKRGYVGTGRNITELEDFWEYTPAEE